MALPAAAYMLEDATHAYYTHFLSQDIAFTEEKAAFLVTFQQSRPAYPSVAYLKLYRGNRAERGLQGAMALQQLAGTSAVLRCYYSFQHKDEAYVFVEYCKGGNLQDKLDKSSSAKAVKEGKMQKLFLTIAASVQKCHESSISHGNLELKSFLLTEEKEVKIAGFLGIKQDKEATQAKDVRSLCRIMLEIASSAPAIDYQSKEGVNQALEGINLRFSQGFAGFLRHITEFTPNSVARLLALLSALPSDTVPRSIAALLTCSVCKGHFSRCLVPICGHNICRNCLISLLIRWKTQCDSQEAQCSLCNSPLESDLIASVLSSLPASLQTAYEDHIRSQIQGICPHCSYQFPILKHRKGRWKPYDFTCKCHHCFCTYCGLRGGHKVVVFRRKCYEFEQEQGLRPGK
jgi:tRNA A-37 threonylcarbamoyl transferase component Bud32